MSEAAPSKFARYRARKRDAGKKLIRIWVPDLHAPERRAALVAEMALLRSSPEQADAAAFLEASDAEDGWAE